MRRFPIIVLILLLSTSCSKKADQTKFEPLYRSVKALEATATVGVTVVKYRELIQQAATELSIAHDKATDKEKPLLDLYDDAIVTYVDGMKLWNNQVDSSGTGPDVTVCSSEVIEVARRYDLKCLDEDGIPVMPKESLQYLWAVGSSKLQKANSAYLGTTLTSDNSKLALIKDSIYLPFEQQIATYNAEREQARKEREARKSPFEERWKR